MPDNNPSAPAETVDDAPQTYDEQVEDISALLGDPEDPDPAEDEDHEAAAEGDDPDGAAEDVEDADGDEAADGPPEPEFKGGRFAADDAKFTLPDGTVTTVAEAKRSFFFQRDYTEKTTAVKALETEYKTKKSEVDQQAQSLSQLSEAYNWYAANYLPQEPTPPADPTNYVGFIEYQRQMDSYRKSQDALAYFQQQTQALSQQKQQEAEQARQERVRSEVEKLRAKDPLFRDKAKAVAWFERVTRDFGEKYGFSPQEMQGVLSDHRLVLVMRKADKLDRMEAKASSVRDEVAKKPALATGGKRADPKAKGTKERQARSERLRRDGSLESGIAALMDLDL